jgi:hypothetical protein
MITRRQCTPFSYIGEQASHGAAVWRHLTAPLEEARVERRVTCPTRVFLAVVDGHDDRLKHMLQSGTRAPPGIEGEDLSGIWMESRVHCL